MENFEGTIKTNSDKEEKNNRLELRECFSYNLSFL